MSPDDKQLLIDQFSRLGFRVIHFGETPSTNGVDMWVQKRGRPISVEVKKVREKESGIWGVDPVSPNRRKDDLVAIIVSSEYVLIEAMSDHLKCCSPKGTRQFTILK